MLNSNARRAMAAGSANPPGYIEPWNWQSFSTEYLEIEVPLNDIQIVTGTATESLLSFNCNRKTTPGWYVSFLLQHPAGSPWQEIELKDYDSSPLLVAAGDRVAVYVGYFGFDSFPQSCAISIFNETTGGSLLASLSVTLGVSEPV